MNLVGEQSKAESGWLGFILYGAHALSFQKEKKAEAAPAKSAGPSRIKAMLPLRV